MNWNRLLELISKKQCNSLTSDESYELLNLLEEATNEHRISCYAEFPNCNENVMKTFLERNEMEESKMNEILAKNIKTYIEATGRTTKWIMDKGGIPQEGLEQLLEGKEEMVYLEAFAELFNEEVPYFLSEDFVPPKTIAEKQKEYEAIRNKKKEEVDQLQTLITKAGNMSHTLSVARSIMIGLEEKHDETLVSDIQGLLQQLKEKADLLVEQAEKKEIEDMRRW